MRRSRLAVLVLAVLGLLVAGAVALGAVTRSDELATLRPPVPAHERGAAHHFDVERDASGFNRPTFVGVAPGDDEGLWVLEQPGRVVRLAGGRRTVLLDLTAQVVEGAEQGLLGMAFHPDFATNGRLFLHWSDLRGDTRVAEFRARAGGTIDPAPVRRLLLVEQPEENHNGGGLAFGPDGRLYLGLGDGGGAFDPRATAQDPASRLGKLIATPVEGPPRWRTVLTGLRNPWRFSFDAALGELWIGDVGQDDVEEVNRVLLELDEPPKNLGWSAFEGTRRIDGHDLDRDGELVWPVATYEHGPGCSITGGVVYGGGALPSLARRYVYGDFCAGSLWSLRGQPGGTAADVRRERATVPQLTHIGVDADGELLFASGTGAIYRAVAPGTR
jgi:glucose/arabinose dehydrogenase